MKNRSAEERAAVAVGAQRTPLIPCLVNVTAGNGEAVLEAAESDGRFAVRTCAPDELPDAVRAELASGARRIAVAGGDGTMATAAGALVGSSVELAVIPAGTRDHFARSLDVPIETGKALEVAAEMPSRSVDVGFVNDRLFLNTSSVGAYINFVRERERWRRPMGYHLASVVAAAGVVVRPTSLAVELLFENQRRRYRTSLVFFRVREREEEEDTALEAGLRLAVVSGRTRRLGLAMLALTTALRGFDTASRTSRLKSFFVDGCTIEVDEREISVAVDGETIQMRTPLTYRLERDALEVVTGENRA